MDNKKILKLQREQNARERWRNYQILGSLRMASANLASLSRNLLTVGPEPDFRREAQRLALEIHALHKHAERLVEERTARDSLLYAQAKEALK